MVFERIEANTLYDLSVKIDDYLRQYDPRLFDTDIAELKQDKRTNEWFTTITRHGELLNEAKRIV
jgi:hypothetical protein